MADIVTTLIINHLKGVLRLRNEINYMALLLQARHIAETKMRGYHFKYLCTNFSPSEKPSS